MTELEQIQYAKKFLDKMAKGINPLDDSKIKDGDLLTHKRIAGCMSYLSTLLDDVIERKARQLRKENQVPLDVKQLNSRGIVFSETPISLSMFISNLKGMYTNDMMKRLKRTDFFDWMVREGILIVEENEGNKKIKLTENAIKIGIREESRLNAKGVPFVGLYYTKEAQRFLASKIPTIIAQLKVE